jgi:hypothetical protein
MAKPGEIIRNKIVHALAGTPDEVLKAWADLAKSNKKEKVHGQSGGGEIFYFNKDVLTIKRDAHKETVQQLGELPGSDLSKGFEGDVEYWTLTLKANKAKPDYVANEQQIQAVKDLISEGKFEIFTPAVIQRAPIEYPIAYGL